MQTITIESATPSRKSSMHQVSFKKDGQPSVRVAFAVQGDYTIRHAKEVMLDAARKFKREGGFEKMVVLF